MDEFRSRFRTVDLLLVDDIEFLAGKEATQEEFFHTFNVLYQQNRQIVISSDRPPSEILPLEARLRSRFQSGLIADIQPPDFETRLAILKSKIANHTRGHWIGIGHLLPEEVLLFIASRIRNNIRELEGALIRLLAHAALHRGPITVELAGKLLRDLLPPSDLSSPDMNSLSRAVASFYHVGLDEIRGKRRDRHVILPRQVAMYLIREGDGCLAPGDRAGFRWTCSHNSPPFVRADRRERKR